MILDASVAAKWFLADEDLSAQAQIVRQALVQRRVSLIAPSVIWPEVAHAVVRAVRRNRLDHETAEIIAGDIVNVRPLIRTADVDLFGAFRTALVTGVSGYDAHYLDLGARLDQNVLTADERMVERGRAHGYGVVWLGDVGNDDRVLSDTPHEYQ